MVITTLSTNNEDVKIFPLIENNIYFLYYIFSDYLLKKIFSHSRKARFCKRSNKKACTKLSFSDVVSKNSVRYSSEKVILYSCGFSSLASLGRKRLQRGYNHFFALVLKITISTTFAVNNRIFRKAFAFRVIKFFKFLCFIHRYFFAFRVNNFCVCASRIYFFTGRPVILSYFRAMNKFIINKTHTHTRVDTRYR